MHVQVLEKILILFICQNVSINGMELKIIIIIYKNDLKYLVMKLNKMESEILIYFLDFGTIRSGIKIMDVNVLSA